MIDGNKQYIYSTATHGTQMNIKGISFESNWPFMSNFCVKLWEHTYLRCIVYTFYQCIYCLCCDNDATLLLI